ncbi:Coiled-coil domain-containing protein R3HCC1L [Armadillidium nasatum]|uniref:Coiled-coil domain-containing protein R3HCC1L n=1 Tax=Armadillidium nasatum TaxID=96803 RepID=A0A5N5THW9_9CRUS|nr:Coiled-coil domain-containing protein R3HCC1L [Armadillidium nasatum]
MAINKNWYWTKIFSFIISFLCSMISYYREEGGHCYSSNYIFSDSPQNMSIDTMVAETESTFNRRKAREPTQIYRPPPARSGVKDMPSNVSYYQENIISQRQEYLEALKQCQSNLKANSNLPENSITTSPGDNRPRSRRPDQQFYVPRGRRYGGDTPCSTPIPPSEDPPPRAPSPANSICSVVSEYSVNQIYLLLKLCSLIERCINHDANRPLNTSQDWRISEIKQNEKYKGKFTNGYSKDDHPIHSKENYMHPCESNQSRSHKGKRNRKRGSRSRDHSLERGNNSRRNSYSTENLVRSFYNSNSGFCESYNYDRMNSRNSSRANSRNPSRANSRNPSLERTPYDNQGCEWRARGYSNPTSPVKHSPPPISDKGYRRHSLTHIKNENTDSYRCYNNNHEREQSQLDTSISESKSSEDHCNKEPSLNISEINTKIPPVETKTHNSVSNISNVNEEMNVSLNKETPNEVLNDSSIVEPEASDNAESVSSTNSTTSVQESLPENTSDKVSDNEDTTSNSSISPNHSPKLIRESDTCASEDCLSSSNNLTVSVNEKEDLSSSLANEEVVKCDEQNTSELQEKDSSNLEDKIKEPHSETNNSDSSTCDSNESSNSIETTKEASNPKIFSFRWADEEEETWDSLYDDSGNSVLHDSVKQGLEDSIGKIKLVKPSRNYYEFEHSSTGTSGANSPPNVDEQYGHIIEIYDFPAAFQTQDLLTIFQEYKNFDIKWVDDTHALGIFATPLLAADSLSLSHPFVKTRPLSQAIEASKLKAVRIAERLPFKPRPETSATLARRLVSGALGLRVEVSKEQREAERQKLKKAKEKKRLIAKQKEDAWEGNISNSIS